MSGSELMHDSCGQTGFSGVRKSFYILPSGQYSDGFSEMTLLPFADDLLFVGLAWLLNRLASLSYICHKLMFSNIW